MNDILSQVTLRDCVCAHCWGPLVRYPDLDGWRVECSACGPGVGFVTRDYAERRRLESVAEKVEVERLLQSIGVLPRPPKRTEETILKELGF